MEENENTKERKRKKEGMKRRNEEWATEINKCINTEMKVGKKEKKRSE